MTEAQHPPVIEPANIPAWRRMGLTSPQPQMRSWGQSVAHGEGETGRRSPMVQGTVTPRSMGKHRLAIRRWEDVKFEIGGSGRSWGEVRVGVIKIHYVHNKFPNN